MPLKLVDSNSEKQCTAHAKSTAQRCKNPAAYGCRTCRMHGARKKTSIKRGELHPNYLHGAETLSAKRLRSVKLAELRKIEINLIARGLISPN